eukprot:7937049-Heterocapsa_arctica.AAC.1
MDRVVLLMEVPKVHTCAPLKADGLEIAAGARPVSQEWKTEWTEGMKTQPRIRSLERKTLRYRREDSRRAERSSDCRKSTFECRQNNQLN